MAFSTLFTFSGPPQWWIERGVIVPEAEKNNFGAVSLGQAKWMATQAHAELTEKLAAFGGIGFPIDDLFPAPGTPDAAWYEQQKTALNIGQLKHIAAPFYDRLNEISPGFLAHQASLNDIDWADGQIYPWSDDTPLEENYKLANIGQLKSVFAFQTRVDTDGDSASDFLELQNGTDPLNPGDGGGSPPPTDSDGDGVSDSEDGWALCPELSPERKAPPKYAVIELVDIPSGAWIDNFEINNDLKAILTVDDTDTANYKNYYYGEGALKNLDSTYTYGVSQYIHKIKILGLTEEGYFLQNGKQGFSLFLDGNAHHTGLEVAAWPLVDVKEEGKYPEYLAYCVGPGGTVYGKAGYEENYKYNITIPEANGETKEVEADGRKWQDAAVSWTSSGVVSFRDTPRLWHERANTDAYKDDIQEKIDVPLFQGMTFIKEIFSSEVEELEQNPLKEIIQTEITQSNQHGVNLAQRENVKGYWHIGGTGPDNAEELGLVEDFSSGEVTNTLGYLVGNKYYILSEEMISESPTGYNDGGIGGPFESRKINNRNTILTNSSDGVTMWIDSQLGTRHNQTPQGNPSYQKLVWAEAWGPEPPLNLNINMRGFEPQTRFSDESSRLWFNAEWHSILDETTDDDQNTGLIDSKEYTSIRVLDINDNDVLAAELTKKDGKKVAALLLLLPVEFETFAKEQAGPIGGGRQPNWKPHNLNLNTRQKEKYHYGDFDKCVAHVWSSDKLNMAKYLVGYNSHKELFEDPEIVNWKVNGVKQDSFELNMGREPKDNLITEFKIEVLAKGADNPIDSMIVTVVPLNTVANFARWVVDNQDLTWLQSLPALYNKVTIGGDGKAQNPEPSSLACDHWKNNKPFSLFFDMTADTYYHPDAYHEIRSEEVNGAYGHQACYTQQGGLIRSGVSAGTADKAFYGNTSGADSHVNLDAIPFVWALQLDGTPAQGEDDIVPDYSKIDQPIMHEGWHIGEYLKLRPPIANNKPELAPGTCP